MQTKGKFTLFTTTEFDAWLKASSISRSIALLQNHHTWAPAYPQFNGSNHFGLLSGMESFHIRDRGFDMIAQKLTTFPDGKVALCRPLDRIPAGIKGANQAGICIEHLGNFDQGGDIMTAEQCEAIVGVNAILCRHFSITPGTDAIIYHHWYDLNTAKRTNGAGNTKSCPGSNFFGGNSVAAAATGFVPLVRQRLNAAVPVTPTESPALQIAEVQVDSLNVRAGAGVSFGILKQLRRGVAVQLYEKQDGWCRVAPDRQEWVCERYLR